MADTVFMNGRIWTVDKDNPRAEAVAVRGERILDVGSNDKIKKHISTGTAVVDMEGKLVLPGFIDNHTHLITGGVQLPGAALREAKSGEEFALLVRRMAEKNPGRWITQGSWDHENWAGGKLPSRELIDRYTPGTPVFLTRTDGHMALANSCAMKLSGIAGDLPDPPGGEIARDPKTGKLTGILKDEAMGLVNRHIPPLSEEESAEAVKKALEEAAKYGITGIQDMSTPGILGIYRTLLDKGELTARLYCRLPLGTPFDNLPEPAKGTLSVNEMIRISSLKAFADGSLGSSTALFYTPYNHAPETCGLGSKELVEGLLEKQALEADRRGWQLSIHAIGDKANSLVLDMFEKIVRENPTWDRRFRIEHAQHLNPDDFARFERLGVIASVQPCHLTDDCRWMEKNIGRERCRRSYAFRRFLDNNVKMCFGSDWPVACLNPLYGIHAAVTRSIPGGANSASSGGWFPEERITVEEAVECYTINNAYASFEETVKGSISAGKLADMAVLSDDIFTIAPERIRDVRVEMTVLGGKVVFKR
ncbi:MAG TPA: amidohydrolase [bacterium]|nr:amidohydrolase [bacterium]